MKISMECAEIFKLLDGERKPESEVSWPWVFWFNETGSARPGWERDRRKNALWHK